MDVIRREGAVPFLHGALAGGRGTGTVFVWGKSGDVRLMMIGERRLVSDTDFQVLVDEEKGPHLIRPAGALAAGEATDLVFVAPRALKADKRVVVRTVHDGQTSTIGVFHIDKQMVVPRDTAQWRLVAEFPFHVAEMEGAARQHEATVLLDNFKAMKNNWPRLRDPVIPTQQNVSIPIPAAEFRRRIQGPAAPIADPEGVHFLDYGYEHLRLILRIAETYGATFSPEFTTLDWGVGCGRIARHMPPMLQRGFIGIDVDPVNIGWCQQNIPFGRYASVDPFRPTRFADRSFDLIYSHSVLTHLSEQDQFLWLKELARICRGFMILSVHGLFSIQGARWARTPEYLWQYLLEGMRDSGKENPGINDVTPSGYYRGMAHTPAYIAANWTRFVQVVDIIPGGFGNQHDAVICRPLAG